MRARLVRGGGLAGLRLTATVEGEALEPHERGILEKLVEDAGFWSLPDDLAPARSGGDRFRYELTVEDGRRRRLVRAVSGAIPDTLRPLIAWLEARGTLVGRGRHGRMR